MRKSKAEREYDAHVKKLLAALHRGEHTGEMQKESARLLAKIKKER